MRGSSCGKLPVSILFSGWSEVSGQMSFKVKPVAYTTCHPCCLLGRAVFPQGFHVRSALGDSVRSPFFILELLTDILTPETTPM